jgi:hypothetical protein
VRFFRASAWGLGVGFFTSTPPLDLFVVNWRDSPPLPVIFRITFPPNNENCGRHYHKKREGAENGGKDDDKIAAIFIRLTEQRRVSWEFGHHW